MNNKERIINTVLFNDVDRPPFFMCFGPWNETLERWRNEGLGLDESWETGLGMDAGFEIVDINYGYCPKFQYRLIEDKGNTEIIQDSQGVIMEANKNGASIPRYIEHPIKTRDDWVRIRDERLNPENPERYSTGWDNLIKKYSSSDKIIQLGTYPYGLYGTLRDMMGIEALSISFYDQPELIHEMMDYLTDFWLIIYKRICKDVKVNAIHMWEDMSGKNGSLLSPLMVKEFMLPNYKKIKKFAIENSIPIFSLDTDGDCSELVPLFLESGINLILPFEVAAGSDINDFRKKYSNLCIMGGIDKQAIANGKKAIDNELERIKPMFDHNGYIASIDHLIHPQISWINFNYFITGLKKLIFKE